MSDSTTQLRQYAFDDRGVLAVRGEDARTFLQGLVSNDVEKVSEACTIHAAFLTAQGKYLFDFFIFQAPDGDGLLLDCEADRLSDFARRLKMYKLRSKVTLEVVSEQYRALALFGAGVATALGLPVEPGATRAIEGGVVCVDPRHAGMGVRLLLSTETEANFGDHATRADYDRLRIPLGVPDGTRDMVVDKSLLLECGFDELNGVDWDKGCYMGQELTARTKYRGLIKKRLLPVSFDGPPPEAGTPITIDGREAGEVRSSVDDTAMALLRLDRVESTTVPKMPLVSGSREIRVVGDAPTTS